ncbi:hypothetical protein B0H16DRAFT_1455036 [Mycena metata]|uniref:Uncharacterized protein n=1 Tax=Mycena metata TaxID=1033252 RepID=A0AAD7NK61_9AGAR|nr:hypothetical protein B0H16DRAFT_1455036 [Mycena metata]
MNRRYSYVCDPAPTQQTVPTVGSRPFNCLFSSSSITKLHAVVAAPKSSEFNPNGFLLDASNKYTPDKLDRNGVGNTRGNMGCIAQSGPTNFTVSRNLRGLGVMNFAQNISSILCIK